MTHSEFTVPVSGGDLTVGAWGANDDAPVVVALHGITANHLSWAYIADELAGEARIYAPDLRGRAGSAAVPGPYGMGAHADDVLAVLDHLGVDKATVVGHSMGAYVSAVFAARYPERLAGHVLIDGGVTLDIPIDDSLDIEAVTLAILGPTMERLSMTFADEKAWLDFWKAHPALTEWNDAIEAYVLRDLVGEPPALRSSTSRDAVLEDSKDNLVGEGAQAFRSLPAPTPWVRAPRGLLNQSPGLYTDEVAAEMCRQVPNLLDQVVPDVNHFTIAMSRAGAAAVADVIRSQLER
ncbi:MAG TPA: alpha/beta hydrolase [Acidimicrobiales bacterium]|nr:alpha/beta hydrolase [Acidimicrobiales bacterium]